MTSTAHFAYSLSLMTEHTQNQRQRLNYLEFRAFFTGQISRSDLVQRFGISEAAATRDLAIYRDQAPANLEFDTSTKLYRISKAFASYYLRDIEAGRLLSALVSGVGNDFGTLPEAFIPFDLPGRLQTPSAEIMAAVSRAIFQKTALRIEYFSGSGNHGIREIVPFALASTGLKWMVRAFCRRGGDFRHFILNRIKSAEVLVDTKAQEFEMKDHDDEWNRMLRLELVPHPARTPEDQAKTMQEFRMTDGVYLLRVRAALAGFVLRLWSVDCSENQTLKMYPLGLRNRLALHDVDSAKLAPGYEASSNETSNYG